MFKNLRAMAMAWRLDPELRAAVYDVNDLCVQSLNAVFETFYMKPPPPALPEALHNDVMQIIDDMTERIKANTKETLVVTAQIRALQDKLSHLKNNL